MSSPESPTSAPSSPEVRSAPPLEQALRFDAVQGLWQRTKDVYYAHHSKDATTGEWGVDNEDAYNTEVIDAIHTYLTGKGLDEGSDESSYDFAKLGSRLRDLSFDHMFTRRWKYGDWQKNPDGSFVLDTHGKKVLRPGTSGESRVRKLQLAFTGRDLEEEAREAASAAVAAPETDRTGERLDALRTAKRGAFANFIKGRRFGAEHRANKKAYDEAEKAYLDVLSVKNTQVLADKKAELEASGLDETAVKTELVKFAKEHANSINKADEEEQRRILLEQSGRLGRMLDWYANRSTVTKVAIGATAGVAAFGIGLGLGFLTGGAGTIVGMGAFFGLRGTNAVRAYHLRKAELFKIPPKYAEMSVDDDVELDQLSGKQREFLEKSSRDHLTNAEKIKARNVWWTLGSVALVGAGGVAGVVAHMATFDSGVPKHLTGGQLQHELEKNKVLKLRAPWDKSDDAATSGVAGQDVTPAHSGEGTLPSERYPDGSAGPAGIDKAAVVQDYINQHADAIDISKGEGWYQTFKELGVKPEDYHKLLQEVGDDLHKQGIAYWDNAHGEWRMNMTPDHTMPDGALKTIVEHAQADGYLKNPLNFGAEVTQTGQVSGVDHAVSLWHGAPTESVLQETYGTYGGTLSNSQAYEAINAMYSNPDIGSHGVFDGATLSTPSSGDIWIDQDHGSVSLTPKAKEFLDTFMASQPKVGENLASVETLAISDFHPETMDQLLDKLNAAHVVDVPKAQYGQAAKQMGSLLFRNDLAFYDRHSHTWELNTVNWSKRNVVDAVAYLRNHFTRAA